MHFAITEQECGRRRCEEGATKDAGGYAAYNQILR